MATLEHLLSLPSDFQGAWFLLNTSSVSLLKILQ
ncbi:hypothetical protein CDA46_11045 [Klebsiella pneumoniae]|nr:hypothetical protein CDA34_07395 [Klebsiella pneumoniae]OZZ13951.1 hypothetical protein CDA46_11045 [Klebsiella pneumoniae]OZZ20162.1 hypothetical protein CDA45_22695 [Klebsiella pneumoniae]OZZ37277.1 hypothetical protein CDA44_02360 [Klebsiella pneumoniae]PNC23340.1 hypothetical protein CK475_21190 [Enterobacter cloacae]